MYLFQWFVIFLRLCGVSILIIYKYAQKCNFAVNHKGFPAYFYPLLLSVTWYLSVKSGKVFILYLFACMPVSIYLSIYMPLSVWSFTLFEKFDCNTTFSSLFTCIFYNHNPILVKILEFISFAWLVFCFSVMIKYVFLIMVVSFHYALY